MLKILRNFLLLWGLVLLQACAGLGTPPLDTFNKKFVAAATTLQATADGATILRKAGKFTPDEVAKVQEGLQASFDGLVAARALASTDLAGAQTRLTATIQVLTVIQALVAAKQETLK